MKETLTPKQRKKLKRVYIRRRVLLLLLLIAIVIGICLFTPFFNIKKIEVVGNTLISTEQILETASIPSNVNMFKISTRKAKKTLLTIPELESVTIRRLLPSKIKIEVTEATPVMSFPYQSGYVVTNDVGRVLSVTDSVEGMNLLNITGLEIKNAEICEKISVQDTAKFDIIINTIQFLNREGLLHEIRSGHFDNSANVHFYMHDGTKIIFGKVSDSKHLEYTISFLKKILEQAHRGNGAYIDLSVPEPISGFIDPPKPSLEPESEEAAENSQNTDDKTKESESEGSQKVQETESSSQEKSE